MPRGTFQMRKRKFKRGPIKMNIKRRMTNALENARRAVARLEGVNRIARGCGLPQRFRWTKKTHPFKR